MVYRKDYAAQVGYSVEKMNRLTVEEFLDMAKKLDWSANPAVSAYEPASENLFPIGWPGPDAFPTKASVRAQLLYILPIMFSKVVVGESTPDQAIAWAENELRRLVEEEVAYIMIAPAVFIIFFLIGYPFVYSIFLSLTNTSVGRTGSFVGLLNFARLLKNTIFQRVLINSGIFTVGSVTAKFVIGLAVALLIEKVTKGSKFIRGTVLLPWVVPTSLSALAWWWMFNPNFSVLNWIITCVIKLSSGVPWLSDAKMAMFSVILVHVWSGVPFFAISLLAGLVSINREYYEVADTEGAREWQKFLYITLPLLKPVIAIVLLFSTLMTISEFNIIYILTGGGPRYSTHLLATLAYQEGIATGNLSRGAAISLFLFPLLFVASYLQIKTVRENVRRF